MQTFMGADSTMQSILRAYDASIGINNNQLSGKVIVESATQSNAAAMSYVVRFLQSLNQVAQIKQNQVTNSHKAIELGLDKENIDMKIMKLMADLHTSHNENMVQLEKAQTVRLAKTVDWAIKNN